MVLWAISLSWCGNWNPLPAAMNIKFSQTFGCEHSICQPDPSPRLVSMMCSGCSFPKGKICSALLFLPFQLTRLFRDHQWVGLAAYFWNTPFACVVWPNDFLDHVYPVLDRQFRMTQASMAWVGICHFCSAFIFLPPGLLRQMGIGMFHTLNHPRFISRYRYTCRDVT